MQVLEKGATQGSFKGNIIFEKVYCQEQGAFSRKRAKIPSKEEVAGRPREHREQLQEEHSSQRKSWIWCVHSPSKGEYLRNPQKYFRRKRMDFGNLPYSEGTKHQVTSASVTWVFFSCLLCFLQNQLRMWQLASYWGSDVEKEQGAQVATLSSSPLILNFMCQFGWTKGCPDSWYTLFQAVSVRLFPKEITSIWIKLSEDHPYQCRGHQPSVEGLNHRAKSQRRGKRRRGWYRMRWLDGITDSTDMSFSKLRGGGRGKRLCGWVISGSPNFTVVKVTLILNLNFSHTPQCKSIREKTLCI